MTVPTMHNKPPSVYIHHALVHENDLQSMTDSIGRLGFRIICVQSASTDKSEPKFWITAAKIENFLQRLEEEEKKNMRVREMFGPYIAPQTSYDYYKNS